MSTTHGRGFLAGAGDWRYLLSVRRSFALLFCLTALAACAAGSRIARSSAAARARTARRSAPNLPPEFIDVDFAFLHPIFLRHGIGPGPKAALWAERYHRRWVRWTGRIRSFTPNGITLRQLPITSTFDVSLWVNNAERESVRARYHVGDIVTYVGRLDSYDDIWRTLYLVNGSVLSLSPVAKTWTSKGFDKHAE